MRRLFCLLLFLSSSLAFAQQTFTLASAATAMGAGDVSRAFTITVAGALGSTANFALTDGAAGGTFSPSFVSITGAGLSTQFLYITAPGASGNITLQAVGSGGATGTHTITLPIETNNTVVASDNFSGTSGTTLVGKTATVGGTWTQAAISGTMSEQLNGSGGLYQVGTGTTYNEVVVPTAAATAECDTQVTVSNANLTKTFPGVLAMGESTTLSGFWLVFSSGWQLIHYPSGTVDFNDTTVQQLTAGGTATILIAVRQLNGSQIIYGLINGHVLNAASGSGPSTPYTCNGDFGGNLFFIASGQTPASTDSVFSNFSVKNVDWSSAGLISSVPSIVPASHSGNISLALTGTGTAWTSSTTFSVSGVSGVSVVSHTNHSGTSETLVISDGASTGTVTISGSDGSAGSFSIATASLAISPTSGSVSSTPTLTLTGTNTIWTQETASTLFSESGGTGASIGSISVSSDTAATAVLTTGSATGTETITDNSTGKTATFTVASPLITTFPNANIFLSPYTWRLPGDGTIWAPAGGPYLKFSISGTTQITANIDTAGNTLSTDNMPALKVIVDDTPAVFVPFPVSATQVTLASGLSTGTHTVVVYALQGNGTISGAWSSTIVQVHIQSLQFDSGSTLSPYPIIRPKNCFLIGDSFLAGYYGAAQTGPYYSYVDPSMTWAFQMDYAMNCEVGVVGIGSQGFQQAGNGGYPAVGSTWNHYDSTHARSLSPTPDYVVMSEGINDHGVSGSSETAAVQSWLTAARSAMSSSKIWVYVPIGGEAGDQTGTGGANATSIRNAVAAQGDPAVFLIDTGLNLVTADNWSYDTWFAPNDSIHPAQTSHGILAAYAVQQMQQALGSAGGASNYGFVQ